MDDDALWKRRFLVFTVVRLAGLALILLGMAITYSDLVRPGGLPAAGLPLMLLGLAQAVLAPRLLKRIWRV